LYLVKGESSITVYRNSIELIGWWRKINKLDFNLNITTINNHPYKSWSTSVYLILLVN
jgi:hypothetical protein